MDEQKSDKGNYTYLMRQSPVFLVSRIIVVELLVLISHFLLRYSLQLIFTFFSFPFSVEALFVESVIIQVVNLYFLVIVVLSWVNEYYILNPKEVVIRRGIISSRSTTYEFANLQSMTVRQTILGRIFNYGTIKLYNPVLRADVYLTNIPNPQKCGAIIQQHQPEVPPILRKPTN